MVSSKREAQRAFLLAGVLAWLLPGAGHWYLGRRRRAIILCVTIQLLFWSGMAIGGVFTINPRQEAWWTRAQLCTGAGAVASYYRQQATYRRHALENARVEDALAEASLALVWPASGPAYVLSGVAGMLNLMCVFDAVMLGLLGRHGEPPPQPPRQERRGSP